MKISYNWLKDYVNLKLKPEDLANRLSLAGLEVEEVTAKRLDYPGVVVGRVISVMNHPNADKLKICSVDVGKKQFSIICGAPNVAKDQTVPVAQIGTELPNGLKIKKTKIREVYSEGMICSEAELGLADKSEGIWVLPDTLKIGEPLHQALQFESDFIYDVAVTPNRPDCLSHIGVAREVAALTRQKLRRPKIELIEEKTHASSRIKIRIDTPNGCPRYSARFLANVKIGDSPRWLIERLETVGLRSINNVVDVTNYVLMETGHPLHAFDIDLIEGSEIIVRESDEGEKFTTLDDQERLLKKGTVLICDARKPVAIGGIMGGQNSEVNMQTKNILLESAYFNPESIQISARHLGLSTEASQRFERGADPNGNIYALDRAAQLIREVAGGNIYSGIVDTYPKNIKPCKIPLELPKINNLLGTQFLKNQVKKILEGIELVVENDAVLIPTFRPDLKNSVDLAEEVARLYGLDNIPASQTVKIDYNIKFNELDIFIDKLKNILTGFGLQEIITSSMINSEVWQKLTGEDIYPVLNPISKDMDGLRNSLIPSMAMTLQYNQNRQIKDLKLFEINPVFIPPYKANTQPIEDMRLAIGLLGKREFDLWFSSHQNNDFFDIKGLIEAITHKIFLDNWQFISYSAFALEGVGLGLQVKDETFGFLGKLSNKIASLFEIDDDTFVAEISLTKLFKHLHKEKKYTPIPRFPSVERDLALIVNEDIESGRIAELINKDGGKLLTKLELFDLYQGTQISADKKSVGFRLTFQSQERTLTEEEITESMNKILRSVEKQFEAKLRA